MASMSPFSNGSVSLKQARGPGVAGFLDSEEAIAATAAAASSTLLPADYTVVIPVLNQLRYTQRCVASLMNGGTDARSILVIDNGSNDDTPRWLESQHHIGRVRNRTNLGCGGAWTQGALLSDCEWVVLL